MAVHRQNWGLAALRVGAAVIICASTASAGAGQDPGDQTTSTANLPSPAPETPPSSEARPLPVATRQAAATREGAVPIDRTPLKQGAAAATTGASIVQTIGALAGVLGAILIAAFLVKRFARAGGLMGALGPGGRAPSGVLEVLGRYPVSRGMTLVLIKFDRRVLLLSQAGAGLRGGGASMSTLCEIVDPEDVASILLKVRDDEGDSLAKRFQSVLTGADRDVGTALGEEPGIQPSAERIDTLRLERPGPPAGSPASIRSRLGSLKLAEQRAAGGLR